MDFTTGQLFVGLVASSVGFGLFLYGKQQRRGPQLLAGVLLMVLPVLIQSAWYLGGASALVVGGLWFAVGAGL